VCEAARRIHKKRIAETATGQPVGHDTTEGVPVVARIAP
jgi:hypothetical protein